MQTVASSVAVSILSFSFSGHVVYWSIHFSIDATATLKQSAKDPGLTYRRPISVVLSITIHGDTVSKYAEVPGDSGPVTRALPSALTAPRSRISVWSARPGTIPTRLWRHIARFNR